MAIEKQFPEDIIETTTTEDAETDNQIIDVIEAMQGEEDVQMQEDGSAILGPEELEMPDVGFSENLAEVISDTELSNIHSELISGIENDKSSRKDWEKTYTCLLYTSPSPRDGLLSRMPSSA